MFWYVSSSIAMGLASLIIYFYYMRKGQFEDAEDVKYQIFREKEYQMNDMEK
ncbi:MAG: cbb3-type cytochrome oxidase assembly protein CcoS [Parachlamydiaceae bacterium]